VDVRMGSFAYGKRPKSGRNSLASTMKKAEMKNARMAVSGYHLMSKGSQSARPVSSPLLGMFSGDRAFVG
jgi:hypothetical protein